MVEIKQNLSMTFEMLMLWRGTEADKLYYSQILYFTLKPLPFSSSLSTFMSSFLYSNLLVQRSKVDLFSLAVSF